MKEIYGLLGRHLGHSFSAIIHKELGCPDYGLIELEPEQLGSFLQNPDIRGLNVTIPYKRDVMQYCAELSDEAKAIGSVNTISRLPDGGLLGSNTDLPGFEYMASRAGISLTGKKVVILGSGGASLTVQAAAGRQNARQIVVVSRSGEDNYENLSRHSDAEIVVNATPVGMYPDVGKSPCDLTMFPKCEGVLDLIYNPAKTAFLIQAEKLGIPNSNGLPMLVSQAMYAEKIFGLDVEESVTERIVQKLRVQTGNIVIIGMPGSGKTTVGQALAELTGREAIDVDELIVQAAGMSIPEIFAQQGEESFRAMEREQTAIAGAMTGKIILTGGGVVKDDRNLDPLRQNGRIYQVCRDVSLLATDGRPLSQTTDLNVMLKQRAPMYAKFRDVEIDNNGAVADAAQAIWRDYEAFGN